MDRGETWPPIRRLLAAVAWPSLTTALALISGYAFGRWPVSVGIPTLCALFLAAAGIWFFLIELSEFRRTAYAACVTMTVTYIAAFAGLPTWVLVARGVETTCSVVSRTPSPVSPYDSTSKMQLSCADGSRQEYVAGPYKIGDRIAITYDPRSAISPVRTSEASIASIYAWVAAIALSVTVLLRLVEAIWAEPD